MHLVGDMAELVKALGETKAIIVGHDWGAPVAWHAALWRPDLFPAVCAMSVPYSPPGYIDILTALAKLGITDFYLQYFQRPGVPEAELQKDVKAALRRLYYTASGDLDDDKKGFGRLPDGTLLGNTADPEKLPGWLSEADLDYYTQEFTRAGFRGGLNWYRNLRRNWELGGPWRGQPIRQPSLFIAGKKDGVLRFPAAQAQLDAYPKTLPGLRGCHLIEGAGHWVQQEKAAEVNRLLIGFISSLRT
jgi:pimeloyl-ACP methyl ester carboxylesterase